jgi:hypothetical protein
MMMISGVDFRTPIPPGLFILLLPAGLVAFGRWRWTLIVATLAGLFIFVSYFLSGSVARLLDLSRVGELIGLWLQLLASFVTVVAGMVATIQSYLQHSPEAIAPSRMISLRRRLEGDHGGDTSVVSSLAARPESRCNASARVMMVSTVRTL